MSELSNSHSHYSTILISNLIRLSSFIICHPIYFSYVVFISPYLLKLISFLSPIILATFLLFIAFLAGFFRTALSKLHFASILERFHFKKLDSPNEDLHLSDDLGMYEIVFGPPPTAAMTREDDPSEFSDQIKEEDPAVGKPEEDSGGNKRLENFLKMLDQFERLSSNVEERKKKLEPTNGAKSDKVVEKQNSLLMDGSEAAPCNNNNDNNNISNNVEERSSMAESQSQRIIMDKDGDDEKLKLRALDKNNSLRSEGSMRREREWERTLACKLFEERRDVSGGEGMDSLWEAYEMEEDSVASRGRRRSEKMRREKIVEEEDEDIRGQLCCLQALKLSAGKMILGVGKPNLVKISRAIKGVGWLHKTTKNSKKVHNHGGDHRY